MLLFQPTLKMLQYLILIIQHTKVFSIKLHNSYCKTTKGALIKLQYHNIMRIVDVKS